MSKQLLKELYDSIEEKRIILKKEWIFLKEVRGDKIEIKKLGRELTKLTYNQAHILIDLEWI